MTPETATFIERAVDTIHQLEVLMLLRRSPGRFWRVEEVADQLRMSAATVGASARGLQAHGVLVTEDASAVAYQYHPQSIALHADVENLVAAYETDPLQVVKAVLDKGSRGFRTFSDAPVDVAGRQHE